MAKCTFLLFAVLTMVSCGKSNDAVVPKKDYTEFLAQSTATFSGKIVGEDFSWTYGWQSQKTLGYENDPFRVVYFGLTSNSDLQTRFMLYSPRYNSESATEFSKVFGLGKKKLGDYGNEFYLSMYIGNVSYQSSASDPANVIEVLKTQEFTDNNKEKIRVWFRIDAKLSSSSSPNDTASVTDGLMIGEFLGYRNVQHYPN